MSAFGRVAWLGRWLWGWLTGRRRMVAAWLVLATVASWARGESLAVWVTAGLSLPLALAGWAWRFPAGYERSWLGRRGGVGGGGKCAGTGRDWRRRAAGPASCVTARLSAPGSGRLRRSRGCGRFGPRARR